MTDLARDAAPHAVIVGAGPGLGAALARRFGREGFAVTLVGRRGPGLAAVAEPLRSAGISVQTAIADAADAPAFRATVEALAQRVRPGIVVYNAAAVAPDSLLTADLGHLHAAYAVDVLGAVSTAQAFTPAMRRAGAGTFLATGGEPAPAYATLSLGKAALRAALALLHDELKGHGVHAACITIGGAIAPGTAFDPDRIAEAYWSVHTRPAGAWTAEVRIDSR